MLKPLSRPFLVVRVAVRSGRVAFLANACLVGALVAATGCHRESPSTSDPTATSVGQNAEPSSALTRVTLSASRDTSVREDAPNRNFGSELELELNRTIVAFDTEALRGALGPQDYLASASLELTLSDNELRRSARPRVAGAFRLTRDWTESGATWNCAIDANPQNHRPDCWGKTAWSMDDRPNPWATPATDIATISARQAGIVDFDVTSDVRGFLAGTFANDGWILKGTADDDFAEFASRETATPPVLALAVRRCSPALCDDGNACTRDACDALGACTHAPLPNDTACDDGNACTAVDSCQAGVCVGTSPVTCGTLDQCHLAGTCDPATGACSNPQVEDGTVCNDGNACTQIDTCLAGTCVGASPIACAAPDPCHLAGACDPSTGICSNPAADDGTGCDDGNGCTVGDTCVAGACNAGSPKVCAQGADGCHPGVCDPSSGACSNPLACQLAGLGSVPGTALDGLDVTPLTLPDGIPHNQIGGFGSAIAYTGIGNLYLVVPDRGPDAGVVGFTDRYYQIELTVSDGVVTTLFRGGATLNKSPGDPFTGLDSAFDVANPTESRRLDPEGLRVGPNGTFFVSDEYGPFLYEFEATGNRVRSLAVPPKFLVAVPGIEDDELPPTNTSGRQDNRGMEGLAISPDGSKLYGIMQSPLIQDSALDKSNQRVGTNNRILEVDVATGATREFLYQLDDKDYGVNEMLAVNDHQFLVLERDGNGGTSAKFKRLFLVDLAGATDISGVASLPKTGAPADVKPVSKAPFLDLLAPAYGLAGPTFPEKVEGIAFGPDRADGSHLLIVTQDNDFITTQPSRIFAFAIAPAALPAWQPGAATFSQACVSPSPITCPTTNVCRHDGMCNPGTASCTPPALPAGTLSSEQTAGDCLKNQCDGQGNVISSIDDTDVPADDGNACTTEVCASGVPLHPAAAAGAACNQGGGALCDGAGACVSCLTATDCPGVDTACTVRACLSGSCGTVNLPAGAPIASQTPGDCHQNQCDGFGNVVSVVDDTDLPVDANPCTADVCTGGVASNPPSAVGFSCGGANVCDGAGSCVGCVTAADCPGSDTECATRTCAAGVCGTSFAALGTTVSTQTVGDCHSNRCDGAGNVVSVIDDTDVFVDGNACTTDACSSGVVTNALVSPGTRCSQAGGTTCDALGQCTRAFMVVRMGTATTASLTSSAAPVFVDEYTIDGALLRTIALPTTLVGSQRRFVNSGQASSEGALALSYPSGKYLTLAGYDADVGIAGVASSASGTTNRVVARIDSAGNVDTSTAIANSFIGNNVRGAVTDDDGQHFWVSGAAGGVQLVNLGGTTSVSISSNLANVRTLEIFAGQLYGAASSGVFNNVFTVGTGLPTTSAPVTALAGFPTATASPFAFVFADSTTLYVADDRTSAAGGIQKWKLVGTTWTLTTTFSTGFTNVGARGLAGYASDAGFVLVATTAEKADPSGQHIVKLVDTGSGTPTPSTLVTGSLSVAYRGVALPPL